MVGVVRAASGRDQPQDRARQMSVKAMVWALEEAPESNPATLLVLIALAEHADENGRDAFPGHARLADRARMSVRSVQRNLRALEDSVSFVGAIRC